MQALPHFYNVNVTGTPTSQLTASSKGLTNLVVDGPSEFGGPGDQWSPETLMMSAVANCFVLSFKAVSNASKFPWKSIQCESEGKLDKVGRAMTFTQITHKVTLVIGDASEKEKALKLLEKSEAICLVSNSLKSEVTLECDIQIEAL